MIRIVTDSACDVPPDVIEKHNISVVPLFINVGEKSYADGVDLTRKAFYEQLSSFSHHPSTAAPSTGTFAELYESLAAEGATHIISIHLAGSLSNTYNAARLGSEAANIDIPVTLIDTDQITIAAGLLITMAAEAVENGRSPEEIISMLNKNIPNARIFGMIDTLESLRRGGRVNWAQFGIGTLLQIKPIMTISHGSIDVIARVRTKKKAIPHLQKLVEELAPFERIAILHTNALPLAEQLHKQATELYGLDNIPIVEVGPVVGTHLGVGAVGFGCISKG